ncbi:hypothetical protein Y032_0286g1379 [Ancylostoma ceylanicum]|uniref:Uncharacterized protein n=1 Tax=Ancylostoma ceylanicum TaxID=53326 RepID=A0A016S6E3_9BILA|nr:hypothetical protein Y032_0286g1379 [Ancylostoma ceylanicum]
MLKAPIEKPYKSSKRGAPGRPSSFGRKAKITVRQVRQFFGLLKKQLGDGCTGTLFNSPTVMTGLACGVSRKTVTRSLTGLARLDDCKSKEPDEKNTLRMTTIKKFGQEWGDAVHHFVNTVLEEEGNVTVTDLHGRLSSAYADFPMCSTTLYGFLRALGFSYRKEEDKIYILGENKSESESESESEDEDDDENV